VTNTSYGNLDSWGNLGAVGNGAVGKMCKYFSLRKIRENNEARNRKKVDGIGGPNCGLGIALCRGFFPSKGPFTLID
jgi:hypothetical protein